MAVAGYLSASGEFAGRPPSTFWLQRASQRSAAPVDLVGPGEAVVCLLPPAPGKSTEGARDAKGPGRTQVYASRRKQKCSDPRASAPHGTKAPSSAAASGGQIASPPVPRRPARGVYRLAPHGPRWTDLFRRPASPGELEGRLSTALGPRSGRRTCDRSPVPAITGPRGARQARRDTCGLDRRALASHLRCKVIPRPPLPAPCLKMLYRHPSVRGGIFLGLQTLGILSSGPAKKFAARAGRLSRRRCPAANRRSPP